MKRNVTVFGMTTINGRIRSNNGYSVCLRKIDARDFKGCTP